MRRRLLHFFLAMSSGILWPPVHLFAGECTHKGQFYEVNGYVVTKISVEGPFDIARELKRFAGGNGLTLQARGSNPGARNGRFSHSAFLNSASEITSGLNEGQGTGFALAVPRLENCDAAANTLEVTYRVYHLGTPVNSSGGNYALQSPPIKISNKALTQVLSIQPAVGYDAARHFFGGGAMSLQSSAKGVIDDFSVVGLGSSSSIQLQAQLSGTKTWSRGPISYLNYGIAYVNNDLPTGPYAISEKQLSARLAGIGKTKARLGVDLHFGASLDGGNQNSYGPVVLPSVGLLHSPVGSLKLYLGSSWTHYATAVSGSYGLQLGSAESGVDLDFAKQIINASVSTHFLLVDHHPLAVDANVRAGWLTSYGSVPLAERFFGGNVPSPFIPGDAWVIQSNPILRSFPARNYSVSEGAYGGTSIFSVNTDVSYAVWARPLVPKQLADQVKPGLEFQMKTAKVPIADSYIADGAPYKAVANGLSSHAASMAELRKRLQAIKLKPDTSSDLSSAVDDALEDLDNVDSQMKLLGTKIVVGDALSPYFNLVMGEGTFKGHLPALADDLSTVVDQLKAPGQVSDRDYLLGVAKELQTSSQTAETQFKAIDRTAAEAKAEESLRFPNHIIGELMDTVNLYSISPTILFDAARLGPQPSIGGDGTRYGVGPAIRFGLVNVDFTVGYSFNVQERPGEPRGAAVFGLTFENLF